MKKLTFILVLLFITTAVSAEMIKLKSGEIIEGEIIEKTDDYIKIVFEGGELTLYLDEIQKWWGNYEESPHTIPDDKYQLFIKFFQAMGKNDPSLCDEDDECLEKIEMIRITSCLYDACSSFNGTKSPFDCLKDVNQPAAKQFTLDQCNLIKSPPIKGQEFKNRYGASDPSFNEDDIVELIVYVLALKVTGDSCMDYLKNYLGPYDSPNWTYRWYKNLAACRILSRETPSDELEKDFSLWHEGNCQAIVDPELWKACEAAQMSLIPFL